MTVRGIIDLAILLGASVGSIVALPLVLLLTAEGPFVSEAAAQTPLPDAITAPGEAVVTTLHAEGAQVYDCKADASGKLGWAFREPIATLMADGKTVGRHYAGPNWEYSDGSAVVGKAIGNAPGATAADIPWLKLEVTAHRGSGVLHARHNGPAHQHQRRQARRRLRESWRVQQERALLGGVRLPEEGLTTRQGA